MMKFNEGNSWTYLSKLSLGCGFQLIQLFATKQFLWTSQQFRRDYKGQPWQNHSALKDPPTAPPGTQMAWTEPSGSDRAFLRNSISVDRNTSLRSMSCRGQWVREEKI